MIIRRQPPRHPRQGPSCLLFILVMIGVASSTFVIQNAAGIRQAFLPTPTSAPTREAVEYIVLADIAQAEGDFDRAISYYETALEMDASRTDVYARLIDLYIEMGAFAQAVAVGEQAATAVAGSDEIWTALAGAYLAYGDQLTLLGQFEDAEAAYESGLRAADTAVGINAKNATAYAYAAGGLVLANDRQAYERAQQLADFAIYLEPDNATARYYMAVVLTYFGYYTEARAQYQLGIAADPASSALHIGLAYNYFGTGYIPEAILSFEDAIAVDPQSGEAYDGLAYMYLQLGDTGLAVDHALKAVRLNPQLARAHGRLGEAYLREGNYIQAVKQLEIAAELYANVNDRTVRFYYLLVLAYAQSPPANCAKARAIAEEIALISADYGAGAVEAAASCPDASFLNP